MPEAQKQSAILNESKRLTELRNYCAMAGLVVGGRGGRGSRLGSHEVSPTIHRNQTRKVETVV